MVRVLLESKGWEVLSKARFRHRFAEDFSGSAKLFSAAQALEQSGVAALCIGVIYPW